MRTMAVYTTFSRMLIILKGILKINMHALFPKGSQESFEANMSVLYALHVLLDCSYCPTCSGSSSRKVSIPLFLISMPFQVYGLLKLKENTRIIIMEIKHPEPFIREVTKE